MPNESLELAMQEVYALAPNDRVVLVTLQLSHPALTETIYMVQDRVAQNFTLETGETVEFEPVPFRLTPPTSGEDGLQELNIAIDNVDRRISDFLELVESERAPVVMTYRPYLSDDPSKPQLDPPLVLSLTDVKINVFEVAGKASFSNITNLKNLTEYYDRRRFPGLGG